MASPIEIIDFWFEGLTDDHKINKKENPAQKWFMKSQSLDDDIRRRFKEDLIGAFRGNRQDWEKDESGRLALILLFDQFSRNIYRDQIHMYDFDHMALKGTFEIIESEKIHDYSLIHQIFILMPLMHAEDLNVQERSVEEFEGLVDRARKAGSVNVEYFQYNLKFAKSHYEIIKKFWRFPHRNEILGRPSTNEERTFLSQKGASF